MPTASPVSRNALDSVVNNLRALKARLCLGLPVIGLIVAQLVGTVQESDEFAVSLTASLGGGDHHTTTLLVLFSAVAAALALGVAGVLLAQVSRITAVVLVAAHLVAVTVLWGELGGTANSDEFHPVLGYWALALAGLWALIGALTAGEHSD